MHNNIYITKVRHYYSMLFIIFCSVLLSTFGYVWIGSVRLGLFVVLTFSVWVVYLDELSVTPCEHIRILTHLFFSALLNFLCTVDFRRICLVYTFIIVRIVQWRIYLQIVNNKHNERARNIVPFFKKSFFILRTHSKIVANFFALHFSRNKRAISFYI